MAYLIENIANSRLTKAKYFFDANIWLRILRPKFNPSGKEKQYLEFFEKFKSHPDHPKIVVTALLLSEVINRFLRDVGFAQFLAKNKAVDGSPLYQNTSTNYKSVYRPSNKFQEDYISLCEDIKSYHNYYELVPDGLQTEIKQRDILTSPPSSLDFNDNYYIKLSKSRDYIIVTDDSDYFIQDVKILTLNRTLIDKAKELVKVKLLNQEKVSSSSEEGENQPPKN